MSINILSGTCTNFSGTLVDVEINISKGMPSFTIVGLPDTSIKESKDRVRAAIENCGFIFPLGRIIVNLAPADTRKIGSLLDLPIAIGILIASKQVDINYKNEKFLLLGELSLSGDIKGVKGVLPILLEGINKKIDNFIFPVKNIKECKFIKKSNLYPCSHLKEVISFFSYRDVLPYIHNDNDKKYQEENFIDYSDIIGQNTSKRAMVIAAAGHHNIILYGSTGSGKSMLSKAFPSIMPDLTESEQLEIAKVYSYAGLIENINLKRPPFRAVHHTVTKSAFAGGTSKASLHPGEVTLADKGVLFLDELLEFKREVLEILREPLEDGMININRLECSITLPSKFILLGTFNLCPCGKKSLEAEGSDKCICSYLEIKRYLSHMSKAIKDRIDIYNYVPKINYVDITNDNLIVSSKDMKDMVIIAREIQKERFKNTRYNYNSEIKGKDILEICRVSKSVSNILKYYFESSLPSLRAYGKVIKIARTIADIKNNRDIGSSDVLEAIEFRRDYNGEII